ncbi:hypothetical protein JWH05_10775 [Xanthomonas melonis]|nr:hypothetical protein [Xanthomonas melonis]
MGMGANHRKAYVACTGLLCALVAGCASPGSAIASQGKHPGQSTAKSPAVSCPSKDFDTFLKRYADSTDDSVRLQFTDDPLEYEVPTYTVEDMTESSPLTHISRIAGPPRFDLFNYRYFRKENVFDHIEPGEENPEPEGDTGFPFSIEADSEGTRTVYFGMEYEVDSYVFKRSNGCWRMTRVINLRD